MCANVTLPSPRRPEMQLHPLAWQDPVPALVERIDVSTTHPDAECCTFRSSRRARHLERFSLFLSVADVRRRHHSAACHFPVAQRAVRPGRLEHRAPLATLTTPGTSEPRVVLAHLARFQRDDCTRVLSVRLNGSTASPQQPLLTQVREGLLSPCAPCRGVERARDSTAAVSA